jgi:uncharacterized membrane protein
MTSGNNRTNHRDTIDTNGNYSKFLLSAAATLSDLSESTRARLKVTSLGDIANIELMSLDASIGMASFILNVAIARSTSKLMVPLAIQPQEPTISTNKKPGQSKTVTVSTSKRTGSHSDNSRTGQTKKSPKK